MKRRSMWICLLAGALQVTGALQVAGANHGEAPEKTEWMKYGDRTEPVAGTTDEAKATDRCAPDSLVQKKGWVNRLLNYFNDANKSKPQKKFDFSIIGGPHYDTDTKLGLGLVAAGLYRTQLNDTLLPPSNVSLYGDVTTTGFYLLGIKGYHLFPHDRCRINYTLNFFSFPSKYWGIGYEQGNNRHNESDMKRWQTLVKADFLVRLAPHFYAGPAVVFDYIHATDVDRPELLEGMDRTTLNFGAGLTLSYDSRDALTNPHKGTYVSLSQVFRPKWMGNDYHFTTTELQADYYTPLWKGATLAADLRSRLNFGHPSWGMMALLGSSYSMRGYYVGRYRDKHKIESQIELRQHVWKRNGVVVWLGAGTVFPQFDELRLRHVLPNYGVGYRWEFKKNVNVRLDYGFGRSGQSGFIFNINEAF